MFSPRTLHHGLVRIRTWDLLPRSRCLTTRLQRLKFVFNHNGLYLKRLSIFLFSFLCMDSLCQTVSLLNHLFVCERFSCKKIFWIYSMCPAIIIIILKYDTCYRYKISVNSRKFHKSFWYIFFYFVVCYSLCYKTGNSSLKEMCQFATMQLK